MGFGAIVPSFAEVSLHCWGYLAAVATLRTLVAAAQSEVHENRRKLFCTRAARRWGAGLDELPFLDAADARADAEWEKEQACKTKACAGGCGFALPIGHQTGICGICSK